MLDLCSCTHQAAPSSTLALPVHRVTLGITTQTHRPHAAAAVADGLEAAAEQGVSVGRKSGDHAAGYAWWGSTTVTQVSFWRIHWSPVGPGHVCFVTSGDAKSPGAIRVAIYNNKALLDYLTNDVIGT